ncbi:unnamed protein product [Gordionus sp. m RMFG-2023]
MAPTIQSSATDLNDRKRDIRSLNEKKSDLLINIRYTNTLPDVPFEPKLLKYPFDSKRYINYTPTALEKNYKFDIITDHDLGVHIDLIDPDTYKIDENAQLDIRDESLLLEDDLNASNALSSISNPSNSHNATSTGNNADLARAARHAKAVPWLRRTEYISTEYNRFTPSSDKAESKIGYRINKLMKDDDEDLYKDRDSQIKAIDATFQSVKKKATKHYSKPNVHAIEELALFPDFSLWKHPCAQVLFDSDPYTSSINQIGSAITRGANINVPPSHTHKEKIMSQAMIRGMMDESGNQFVAYFLPTDKTLQKFDNDLEENVDFTPEEVYYYQMAREYNWNVKNKSSKGYEENYFLVMERKTVAYYNELETRVRLSKRRLVQGQQSQVNRTKLAVRYRPFNETEIASQSNRFSQIIPHEGGESKAEGDSDQKSDSEPEIQNEKQVQDQTDEEGQQEQTEDNSISPPAQSSDESAGSPKRIIRNTNGNKNENNEENEIFGSSDDSYEDGD